MTRLVLASVMTGLMAFAAVAFWPSDGPSRVVRMAVVQQVSTDPTLEEIESALRDSTASEKDPSQAPSSDTLSTGGEVQLSSLEEPSDFEQPGTEDDPSGLDGGILLDGGTAATEGESKSEPAASFDEIDQALVTNADETPGHPRPPIRKPALGSAPPPTNYSLVERVAEIGPGAVARLEEKFSAAGVAWPPQRLAFLVFKSEKVIEVQAQAADGTWQPVYRYPILRASGGSGPKLAEGDKQVPEGLYRIALLNPNSRYHVSLRVNYPNDFDRAMAKADGRKKLGGDIMIHGKALSIGCIAVGDPASEEFFVMAHSVGLNALDVIIAPRDFRKPAIFAAVKETINLGGPVWLPRLYDDIKVALEPFPEVPPKVAPTIAQK